MNRVDFMNQLERLLQSVAPAEREEAIQYYNDYFDDAGAENEQAVIEALGNPARVAENIRRDLIGNGYGGASARKAQASDRALVEYGKDRADYSQSWEGEPRFYEKAEEPEKGAGMPVWAIAVIATVLVLASPVLFGLAVTVISVVFMLFVTWCALIFSFGAVAVSLLLVLIVLVVIGIICCLADPWVGMALVGGGLVTGAVGLLFLMLTVAMAGIVTPAICRGISLLFRIFRKRTAKGFVKRHAGRAF